MSLFENSKKQITEELINQIKSIDIENITPVEAINKLYDIKNYIINQED